MILAIILIIFAGLIAYIHWIQGALSGFISAVLAAVAACVALGYYEPMANAMSGGKFADQAHAVCLIALFALTYIILRLLFDKFVPGNIRLPSTADKVAGGVFGLVAGIFGCGIVAIAAQTLPLGPSAIGYARYPLKDDRSVTFYGENNRGIDRTVIAELANDNLDTAEQGLLVPFDDIVVGFVSHVTDAGAFANAKPFKSIHPNLMQELFGQRIGIETTAKHTATNAKSTQVAVEQINLIDTPVQRRSHEIDEIRKLAETGPLKASDDQQLLSIRLKFDASVADENNVVRFSPGAVRLVTKTPDGGWKNNFPIGSLHEGKVLFVTKPDDFLFVNMANERGADMVFLVDKAGFFEDPSTLAKGEAKIADGVFVEFKRMAKMSLDGVKLQLGLPGDEEKFNVARKVTLLKPPPPPEGAPAPAPKTDTPPAPQPPAPQPPQPSADNGWDQAPLAQPQLVITTKLNVPVAVETADASGDAANDAFTGSWKGKKWVELDVDANAANATPAKLQAGVNQIAELEIPAGKRMVHVRFRPKDRANSWAWADNLGDFAVFDGKEAHKPHGVYAEVDQAAGMKKILARYDANNPVPTVKKASGTAAVVDLIYLIPAQSTPTEIQYQGKPGGLKLGA